MLFTCIGQKSGEIYETLHFDSTDNEMKLEPVLNNFSEYCSPQKDLTITPLNFSYRDSLKARVFTISLPK